MSFNKKYSDDLIKILTENNWSHVHIRKLLQLGADPNYVNSKGVSAMHLAAGKDPKALQLMLQFDGDPNILSSDNLTPLHVASSWGKDEIIEILLPYNPDVSIQDLDGDTAYDLAIKQGQEKCALLLKKFISTSKRNNSAVTEESKCSLSRSISNYPASDSKQSTTKEMYEHFETGRCSSDIISPNTHHLTSSPHNNSQSLPFFSPTIATSADKTKISLKYPNEFCSRKEESIEQRMPLRLNEKSTTYCSPKEELNHHSNSLCSLTSGNCVHPYLKVADFILSSENFRTKCKIYDDSLISDISFLDTSNDTFITCCEATDLMQEDTPARNKTISSSKSEPPLQYFNNDLISLSDSMTSYGYCPVEKSSNNVCKKKPDLDYSIISYVTVNEYVHHDADSDITLIERHLASDFSEDEQSLCSLPVGNLLQLPKRLGVVPAPSKTSVQNMTVNLIPAHLQSLSFREITKRLKSFGEDCGPITESTKNIYLRKLALLEAGNITKSKNKHFTDMINEMNGQLNTSTLYDLEMKMVDSFTANVKWREGTEKSSFTYLLLDPRITQNLPLRAKILSSQEVFQAFLLAIFYIGKGKASRPYSHLYEAYTCMTNNIQKKSAKIEKIVKIWNEGFGVVSVHCFHSVIPVEAFTREACMIEAIGVQNLSNVKKGDFYGIASTWKAEQKRKMGVYLLQKALQIFLADGERQICIPDLKKTV